jgi:hypothetical protein
MCDFVIRESEYPRVPDFLLAEVDGFANSPEYQALNETERRLPGVVASAFARFLVRLQDPELAESLLDQNAKGLADSYRAIEKFAGSLDEHDRVLLQDEIFESVRASQRTWHAITSHFGPQSKALFEVWRSKNP